YSDNDDCHNMPEDQTVDSDSGRSNHRRTTRGAWSPEEDALLIQAVHTFGSRWSLVAGMVKTRSSTQCARRWCDTLDPRIDKSPWTPEQDQLLLQAVEQYGRTWANIAKTFFPGRTGLALKNRYTVIGKPRTPTSTSSSPEYMHPSLSPATPSPYYRNEQWANSPQTVVSSWTVATNNQQASYPQPQQWQGSSAHLIHTHEYYPPANPAHPHSMPYTGGRDAASEAYMQQMMHSPNMYR
ncbi:hypothetical protein WG66_000492, partial [Moniliophthora roreri]